ncbi:hypothetical protein CLV62_1184 [Dysgonomonas alginatilytica]|uniref:Lipoprotein n=1 Tax=Dysgonomonas alginatilytica TaxID=1605892 RepID=A0A2V3PMA1_9BACT|nr:hypothetical protein [Dysgonomonas alginatilytica]PXV62617.1 hypothetical protein CLV62_1184 [Dysgonomonas alginatilytica]
MKKLLYLILAITLFTACSSDDDPETNQGYTSFVVFHNENVNLTNCIAAYKRDNKYYKLGELGNLTKGKYSPEISLASLSFPITEIYIFSDYNGVIRFDDVYKLNQNTKNIITIKSGTKGIEVKDKTDPTQYPQ